MLRGMPGWVSQGGSFVICLYLDHFSLLNFHLLE